MFIFFLLQAFTTPPSATRTDNIATGPWAFKGSQLAKLAVTCSPTLANSTTDSTFQKSGTKAAKDRTVATVLAMRTMILGLSKVPLINV